jgi:hypothetical protein
MTDSEISLLHVFIAQIIAAALGTVSIAQLIGCITAATYGTRCILRLPGATQRSTTSTARSTR